MSLKGVRDLLQKAHSDESFRNSLLQDPETVLDSFDLTEDEKLKFRKIDEKKLTAFRDNVEKRYSKDSSVSTGDDWWVESVTD